MTSFSSSFAFDVGSIHSVLSANTVLGLGCRLTSLSANTVLGLGCRLERTSPSGITATALGGGAAAFVAKILDYRMPTSMADLDVSLRC